jgi:hypothetical protein
MYFHTTIFRFWATCLVALPIEAHGIASGRRTLIGSPSADLSEPRNKGSYLQQQAPESQTFTTVADEHEDKVVIQQGRALLWANPVP